MDAAARWAGSVLAAMCALTITAGAQSPPAAPLRDLARDLGGRLAVTIGLQDAVHVLVNAGEAPAAIDTRAVGREVVAFLRLRGFKLVDQATDGAVTVRIACGGNLRERVCSADVRKGDAREVVLAAQPRDDARDTQPRPPLLTTLSVRPVFASRPRILDAVVLGERLVVLDTAAITVYTPGDGGRVVSAAVPLAWPAPPPRDLRGRLLVNGDELRAFLPGLVCRGSLDPLRAECTPTGNGAWPGLPNAVLAANANYFTGPKLPPFFTAAPLNPDGSGGWLLAGVDGKLYAVDQAMTTPRVLPGIGDDVASITSRCSSGTLVVAAASAPPDNADALVVYEVVDGDLVALTPPVAMAGPVTALWAAPDGVSALVVIFNRDTDRHEAFLVGVSCAR